LNDVSKRRQLGRDMAVRISQLVSEKISGIEKDIRFTYIEDSFRLWWGDRGDPETTLLITFEQLQTLDNSELKQVIRNSAS
jgi:hypothetical protein